jgi:hypothetical protein
MVQSELQGLHSPCDHTSIKVRGYYAVATVTPFEHYIPETKCCKDTKVTIAMPVKVMQGDVLWETAFSTDEYIYFVSSVESLLLLYSLTRHGNEPI